MVNLWTATDLLNEQDGELYEGLGNLSHCRSRLCSGCLAAERRRSRRRVREVLNGIEPASDHERWRFLTLTAPKLEGASLMQVLSIMQKAWSLLRKRKFWSVAVRAGVKGVEFTTDGKGYHVHIHCLVLSQWIHHEELRAAWTECLQVVWAEQGLDVAINTGSGKAIIDIRLVRPKRSSRKNSIGLDDAINEVCKYITKSESFDKIPTEHLVEIATVERWQRMFEAFGEARKREGEQGEPTFLDTRCLSDGEGQPIEEKKPTQQDCSLMDLPDDMPMELWTKAFELRLAKDRAFRKLQLAKKYPLASFRMLNGEEFSYADVERLGEGFKNALQAWSAFKNNSKIRWSKGESDFSNPNDTCYHCGGLLTRDRYCKPCGWYLDYEH